MTSARARFCVTLLIAVATPSFAVGQEDVSDLNETYVQYGGIGATLLVVLFFGRFLLRALVNKRVQSIGEESMGFMDLDSMRKRGLISEDEYKEMRHRMAERQMQKMKEAEEAKASAQMLANFEKNPLAARVLIDLEAEKAKSQKSAQENVKPAPTTPAVASELGTAPGGLSPRAQKLQQELAQLKPESPAINPGDPLSDPKIAKKAKPTRPKEGKVKDLDQLYAKGLISKEEFERLSSLFEDAN